MVILADLHLGAIIGWLVVGLVAGWLAGKVMQGRGFGILWDIIIGLIGAAVGGFLFSFIVSGNVGWIGSILIAFVGACILIAVVRFIARK